jgi:oleandomycin transport system permease protein
MSPLRAARHGLTLGWRSLLKLKHSPDQLLDVLLLPITFVLVFVLLFGKAVAGDWHAYLQFVLPGIAVQALLFVTLNTAVTLNTDVHTGIFDRFRTCPSPARPH